MRNPVLLLLVSPPLGPTLPRGERTLE